MISVDEVRTNLEQVRARIRAAGGTDDIRVLAVTKAFPPELVPIAASAGLGEIGENYAQELLAKRDQVVSSGVRVHFIGQLQTNKVRQLAGMVDVFASVDRAKLAREIAHRQPGARVYIQVDTSELTQTASGGKGGCPIGDLDPLVEVVSDAGLDLVGLMTVGPTDGGPQAARPGFEAVRSAVDRLGLTECSMGMSDDLDVAVECGATEVRMGTALFGARPVPIRRDLGR